MDLHDCPAQKYLTIYLIVMGVFSILSAFCCEGPKVTTTDLTMARVQINGHTVLQGTSYSVGAELISIC